jgi:hypothetical protein
MLLEEAVDHMYVTVMKVASEVGTREKQRESVGMGLAPD